MLRTKCIAAIRVLCSTEGLGAVSFYLNHLIFLPPFGVLFCVICSESVFWAKAESLSGGNDALLQKRRVWCCALLGGIVWCLPTSSCDFLPQSYSIRGGALPALSLQINYFLNKGKCVTKSQDGAQSLPFLFNDSLLLIYSHLYVAVNFIGHI